MTELQVLPPTAPIAFRVSLEPAHGRASGHNVGHDHGSAGGVVASRDGYAEAAAGVLRDTGDRALLPGPRGSPAVMGRPQLTLYSVAVCCSQMVSSSMSATYGDRDRLMGPEKTTFLSSSHKGILLGPKHQPLSCSQAGPLLQICLPGFWAEVALGTPTPLPLRAKTLRMAS